MLIRTQRYPRSDFSLEFCWFKHASWLENSHAQDLRPQTLFSSACTVSLRLMPVFVRQLTNGDLTTLTRAPSHLNPPADGSSFPWLGAELPLSSTPRTTSLSIWSPWRATHSMVTKHFYLKVHSDPVDSVCWDFLLRTIAIGESAEDVQSACVLLLTDWRWLFLQRQEMDKEQNHVLLAFTLATGNNANSKPY